MGIIEQIHTKFGLSADTPDSAAYTQALGDLNMRINKNRADVAAIEAAIPGAVIASIDGAATERRKLQNLQSEHMALVSAAEATRREIKVALKAEHLAAIQARDEKAKSLGDVLIETAEKVDAIVNKMVDTLVAPLEELKAAQIEFYNSVPGDAWHDMASYSYEIAAAGFKARLLNDKEIVARLPHNETANSLGPVAAAEVAHRLRNTPEKIAERLNRVPTADGASVDEQHDVNQVAK